MAQAPAGHEQRGRAMMAGRPAREGSAERVSKVLNLTPAQQQKAHELFMDEGVTAKGALESMRVQHAAMRMAIKQGAPAEEIDRIAKEGAAAQAQLTAAHAKTMSKLYASLTDEQKKTFDAHPELIAGRGPGGMQGADRAAGAQRWNRTPAQQN